MAKPNEKTQAAQPNAEGAVKTDAPPSKVNVTGEHRATYSRDKKNGGYIIHVEGPRANSFAGRKVPVTRKDGSKDEETLTDLIWTGVADPPPKGSGKPVALYHFQPKPRDEVEDEIPF